MLDVYHPIPLRNLDDWDNPVQVKVSRQPIGGNITGRTYFMSQTQNLLEFLVPECLLF